MDISKSDKTGMTKVQYRWLLVLVSLLILALGGTSALYFKSTSMAHQGMRSMQDTELALDTSYVFPSAKPLAPFSLTDQNGRSFTNEQLINTWSLVFIGYTSCPDVCPTTMAKLASAYDKLSSIADIQIIFLSVDPGRDTAEKLLGYMDFFNPKFIALTGKHTQLFPLSRDLGFVYTMVGDGDNYQVDHSASMTLISPQGEKVAIIKPKSATPGTLPQIRNKLLIADFQKIVAHY